MNNRCSTAIYAMRQIIVTKKTYLLRDESHVEKFRRQQFTIDFTFPADLVLAQNLFGSCVGVGARQLIWCSLKQQWLNATAPISHAISYSDTMNVIPFEGTSEEIIRRGLQLKYIPNQIS